MSETKRKILKEAIRTWGMDIGTSLDEIATNADISRRTLHRHYKGREDLMISVFNFIIDEYLIEAHKIIQDNLNQKDQLEAFLNFDIASGSQYMMFCQLRKTSYKDIATQNAHFIELYAIYMNLFVDLKNKGEVRKGLSLQWLEIFYSTIVESAVRSIEVGLNKEECIAMAWSSFWNGIKTK